MTEEEALLVEAARRGLLPPPPDATGKVAAGIDVRLGEPERPALPQFQNYQPTSEEFAADDAAIAARSGKALDTSLGARAQRFGLGVLRGIRDPIDALAQMAERALPEGAVNAISEAGGALSSMGLPVSPGTAEQSVRAAEQAYRQSVPQGGIDAGRLAGNIAAALPVGMAAPAGIMGGALAGAASGALQPVDTETTPDFWQEKLRQAAVGGATGAAGSAVMQGLAKIVSGASPATRELVAQGVRPTPGQIMGGAAKRVEEGLTSLPVVGDVIKSAQRRGTESFNRAAINKALAPIGEKLSPKAIVGREAIEEAGQKVSQAYDDLLPRLTARADQQFVSEMQNLFGLAQNMPASRLEQFRKIVTDKLVSKFNPQTGTMTGASLKEAESELGRLAQSYVTSADADQRLLGNALKEVQSVLRDLVRRSNPAEAQRLGAINNAYAMLLRMENAASRAGSREGVFSPAALRAATKQLAGSKRQFARGNALLQDFAENAERVLGPRVPDSGTPFRLGTAAGIPLAAGYANPYAGAATGLGLLAYTPAGQGLLAHALASRPPGADAVAQGIRNLAPIAASEAPILYGLLQARP